MFDLQQKAETEDRQAEAKMWSVLVGQIWAGLSGYCIGTANLKEVSAFSLLMFPIFHFPLVFEYRIFATSLSAFVRTAGPSGIDLEGFEDHDRLEPCPC